VVAVGGQTSGARGGSAGKPVLAYAEHGLHLATLGGPHRRLTRAAKYGHVSPVWSPDGRLLAFVGRDRGRPALFVLRPDGTDLRRLVRVPARIGEDRVTLSRPAWSPDGRSLVFAIGASYLAAFDVVDVSSGTVRTIVRMRPWPDGPPEKLTWLPDGRIAFCAGSSGPGYTVRLDGEALLRYGRQQCWVHGPAWSPDGSRYVVVRGDGRGNGQLVVVDRSSRRTRLTNDVSVDPEVRFSYSHPTWSPDGRLVAFLSDRVDTADYDLFVVRAEGTASWRLTWNAHVQSGPTFSPDGSLIAFARDGIRVVPTRGGPMRRVGPRTFDWSWRPSRTSAIRRASSPETRPARRRVIVVRRSSYYRPVAGRLTGIRPFRVLAPGGLVDISRDGRLVSFVRYLTPSRHEVGVVDLHAARVRRLAAGLGSSVAPLSSDGRHIVVRRWRRLFVVDTASGAERLLASGADFGRVSWLDDGRVLFRERAGRLVAVRPGGRPRSFGVRLAARATWSASRDGRYVLYAAGRRVVLLDRATGRHRRLRMRRYFDPVASDWSPDGRHFLVGDGEYSGLVVAVYDVGGRVLGSFRSWGATWSADGRYVVTYGGMNGTAVTYLQSLRVFSLREGATAELFSDRAAGPGLAGPGGWILYARHDRPPPVLSKSWRDVPARLYLGRLSRRWRS
jgi:Tol biopolymer transport system component